MRLNKGQDTFVDDLIIFTWAIIIMAIIYGIFGFEWTIIVLLIIIIMKLTLIMEAQ